MIPGEGVTLLDRSPGAQSLERCDEVVNGLRRFLKID
jgi:hypothetical protein